MNSRARTLLVAAVGSCLIATCFTQPGTARGAFASASSEGVEQAAQPDAASAAAAARTSGKRVEDLSKRQVDRQVFAEPDGTVTAEVSSGPIWARDDANKWASVDTTLVKTGGRVMPTNVPGELTLSAGGDRLFAVAIPEGAPANEALTWQWPTVLPAPRLEGATATYVDAVPGGGDLVVIATPSGFTHNVVLHEPPVQAESSPTFTVPVSTPGAELREVVGGALRVTDSASGKSLAAAPAPVMWDSSGEDHEDPSVAPVDTAIVDTPTGANIVLSPDAEFLTDPETVYPVTIDPSFSLHANADTWVMNAGYTTSQTSSTELRAGTYDDGTHKARSYLKFPGDGLWAGRQINAAAVVLRNFSSTSCNAGAIRASRVTEWWSPNVLSWSNQPAVTSSGAVTYSPAHGSDGCTSADATFPITEIVRAWEDGATNYGLQLAAVTETNPNSWRRYRSIDYSVKEQTPKLVVNFTSPPDTASKPTLIPGKAGYSRSRTPTFSTVVTHPDSPTAQIHARFEVRDTADNLVWASYTSPSAPGSSLKRTVSADRLSEGQRYTVRARGYYDSSYGTLVSAEWSPSLSFTVDTTPPPEPTVSATHVSEGDWYETVSANNALELHSPGASQFKVEIDDAVPLLVTAASPGDASLPWQPNDGNHSVRVTALDTAGNESPSAVFNLAVGDVEGEEEDAPAFVEVLSTRVFDSAQATTASLPADVTQVVPVLGQGTVPSTGVTSVLLDVNISATSSSQTGAFVVWPQGTAPSDQASATVQSSELPFQQMVVSDVGSDGAVRLRLNGTSATGATVDVVGYYTAAAASLDPATQVEATVEAETMQAIADSEGITVEQATALHGMQDEIVETLTEIAVAYPDSYAGAEVNPDGVPGVEVAFKDVVPAGAQTLLAELPVTPTVEDDAPYTDDQQLEVVHAAAQAIAAEADTDSVAVTLSDDQSTIEALVFDVEDRDTTRPFARKTSGGSEPAPGYDGSQLAQDAIEDAMASVLDPTDPLPTLSIQYTEEPVGETHTIRGGVKIGASGDDPYYCTSGFPVRHDRSDWGFITADHCRNNMPIYSKGTRNPRKVIAKASKFLDKKYGDVQFHSTKFANRQDPVGTSFYRQVGKTRTIHGWTLTVKGMEVCQFGRRTSKEKCSKVLKVNTSRGGYSGLAYLEKLLSKQGDSGGPVYLSSSAVGLIHGEAPKPGLAGLGGAKVQVISPISKVAEKMDLKINSEYWHKQCTLSYGECTGDDD